ncbi:MAG: DUF6328 family protein [Nitriliruptorales bacterium]|nr:DUF6328 family protein [Nitriliruptorales bacterium]
MSRNVLDDGAEQAPPDRESVDDAFRSVLEGLRTTLPGVQAVFAFLLIVPLQSSFADIAAPTRIAFYVAFVGSAIASVLLIAPSAHQRLRAPKTGVRRKSTSDLLLAIRLTNIGTAVFAVALASAMYFVSALVFDGLAAVIAAAVIAVAIAWAWFWVPLVVFEDDRPR